MPDEHIPPQDLDAEMALLGSMMMSAGVFDDVAPIIRSAKAFYSREHQKLYAALVDYHETDAPIDLIGFSDWLRSRGEFEEVGGQSYMIMLAESFADWANAEYYARIVAEKHQRREIIQSAYELIERAYDPLSGEAADFTGKGIDRFERALGDGQRDDDEIREILRRLPDQYVDRERAFIRTGLTGFDDRNGGIERGCMTLLAGVPSSGKTALSMWLALQAVAANINVLFVSVEMRQPQIGQRVLAALTDTPMGILRHRSTADDIRSKNERALQVIGPGKLFVRDDLTNVRDITASAKAYIRRQGVGLVVIDYMQLCEPGGRPETRNLEVAGISKAFKRIAQNTGVAMVALSQLNREVAKSNRAPVMSDLRDSGALEQDADVIFFLHRPNGDSQTDNVELELRVAKNRQGPIGKFVLSFDKPRMTFAMGMQQDG